MSSRTSSSAPRRFAVIDCEDTPKWAGHTSLWIDPLRRDGEEWRSYRVWAGELPDDLGSVDGVVVTGSHHSAVDGSVPWLAPLLSFLRGAAAAPDGPRVFGACFGCQALARALGGQVGPNPDGRFVFGAESIALRPAFFTAWFADREGAEGAADGEGAEPGAGRRSLSLLESHEECVLELPPGAELLGGSRSAANEMFALGDRVLGIQPHPELDREALVGKILPGLRERARLDAAEEAKALRSMERALDSRLVLRVIRRFLDGPDT